jgi:5-formyltetrahydrofolate cyclo-ligase
MFLVRVVPSEVGGLPESGRREHGTPACEGGASELSATLQTISRDGNDDRNASRAQLFTYGRRFSAPETDIRMNKQTLRKQLLAEREALSADMVHACSIAAQGHISGLQEWKKARQIVLYVAFRNELDTSELLRQAWRDGKTVLLPRVDPERKGEMDLCPCRGEHELLRGTFGVREPDPLACPPMSPDHPEFGPDLLLTPGLGFDRQGNRLGFGAGYYDRYLAHPSMKRTLKIGFAYSFQILPELPADPWDVRMNALCSEKELTWL